MTAILKVWLEMRSDGLPSPRVAQRSGGEGLGAPGRAPHFESGSEVRAAPAISGLPEIGILSAQVGSPALCFCTTPLDVQQSF
jgi:hypothetical protein